MCHTHVKMLLSSTRVSAVVLVSGIRTASVQRGTESQERHPQVLLPATPRTWPLAGGSRARSSRVRVHEVGLAHSLSGIAPLTRQGGGIRPRNNACRLQPVSLTLYPSKWAAVL